MGGDDACNLCISKKCTKQVKMKKQYLSDLACNRMNADEAICSYFRGGVLVEIQGNFF